MSETIADMLKRHTDAIEAKFAGLGVVELKARLDEMEQKSARRGPIGEMEAKSWGKQFVESDGLKAFAESGDLHSRAGHFRLEIKSTITSVAGSGLGLTDPQRDQPVMLARRQLRIRDLLSTLPATTGSAEYPRQTSRPTAADVVAEGMLKPESAMTFDLVNVPMRVIAHWIPASVQILEDAPQLSGMIDSELRYGLALKEDTQLLMGDGTGQNISGLVANAQAFAKPAGAPRWPALRRSIRSRWRYSRSRSTILSRMAWCCTRPTG